jgi:tetratricopeptide (TPR) repeat protein
MEELDVLKDAVDQSTELWKRGQHSEALRLLDESIAQAEKENRPISVKVLSMHASVISGSMGDLGLVRQYCERVLSHEPENALALYSLADVLFRQGDTRLARQCAAKSYALVAHSSSKESRGLLEVLTKKWPDIGDWQGQG